MAATDVGQDDKTPNRRLPTLVGAAVLAVGAAAVALGAGASQAEEPHPADAIVEREIAGLRSAGLPDDDLRIQSLREDLARSADASDVEEPAALEEADRELLAGQPDYDRGPVTCEVVPGGLLTPDDIDGATCVVAPQPDGTAIYAAFGPDGVVRAVRFGDGPARVEDREVEVPEAAEFEVTGAGEIVLVGDGAKRAVIDFD